MDRYLAAGQRAKDRANSNAQRWPKMQTQLYVPLTVDQQRDKYWKMVKPLLQAGHSEQVIYALSRVVDPDTNPADELKRMIRKFEGGQGA